MITNIIKHFLVILEILIILFSILKATPYIYPIINKKNNCIYVNDDPMKKIFGLGWVDQCAFRFNRFSGFGQSEDSSSYRAFVGPINIIRTRWETLIDSPDVNYFEWCFNDSLDDQVYFFVVLLNIQSIQYYVDSLKINTQSLEERVFSHLYKIISSIEPFIMERIIGWYTLDEPTQHIEMNGENHSRHLDPKYFKLYNKIIREVEDSLKIEHKKILFNCYAIINQNNELLNFVDYALDPNVDIICSDPFPYWEYYDKQKDTIITLPSFSMYSSLLMEEFVDSIQNLMYENSIDKPFYMFIQGNAHKNECPTNQWFRAPSYSESRYQVYYAISQGISGLLPWCARSLYQNENNQMLPYDVFMDIHGWNYLTQVKKYLPYDTTGFVDFFKNEEKIVFGNIRTIFNELLLYQDILINDSSFDSVVFWQIFDPPDLSICQDSSFCSKFLKTLFIKDPNSDYYYLFAINNNRWFPESLKYEKTIQPQIIRFSFCDSFINKRVEFIRQDPFKYDLKANFFELETIKQKELLTLNNIKFFPDSYIGFTQENEKYIYDYFNPGEVHIYKVLISDYVQPIISNIIVILDGKYHLDKFQGFSSINTNKVNCFDDWFSTDISCFSDEECSSYCDGGVWFNIEKKYFLPIAVDADGNVYIVNGLSRLLLNKSYKKINDQYPQLDNMYNEWCYSDILIYYSNGQNPKLLEDIGPWHNVESGYSLPMAVDGEGNIYVANLKSCFNSVPSSETNSIILANSPEKIFYYEWFRSDITKYDKNGNELWTIYGIGPWHNRALGYSLPFIVDRFGNIYVVNSESRNSSSQYFESTNFTNWFKTDITVYDNKGNFVSNLKGIGPWHNDVHGYCLPFIIDNDLNIIVCNGFVQQNHNISNFNSVNGINQINLGGWFHTDITVYNKSGILKDSFLNIGPWHNISAGYCLPMAFNNSFLYVTNGISGLNSSLLNNFRIININGHYNFDGWYYSDICAIDLELGNCINIYENYGPWHNQELGLSFPMISKSN